jgi:DNA-binding MarR family transcriptional regulator
MAPDDDAAESSAPGAYLLVQLGLHSARRFAERLAPLGLEPRHVGLLRALARAEGRSQGALAEALRIPSPRMVALVDELESRGLLERRRRAGDRRAYALHLTDAGRRLLRRALAVAAAHDAELLAGLEPAERVELRALLRRLAAANGLAPGDLPLGPPTRGGGPEPRPGRGGGRG